MDLAKNINDASVASHSSTDNKSIEQVNDFPNGYFHFGGGAKVSDEGINMWISEGLEKLKAKGLKPGDNYCRRSGDSCVLLSVFEWEEGKSCEIEVLVFKDYYSKSLLDVPLLNSEQSVQGSDTSKV